MKGEKTNRPAYSYLRFSTLEQKKGDSHRRQTERPEGVCAEFGWDLQNRTYKDCGVSAFRGKNRKKGDLSLFLAALQAGELLPDPVLILEDLDRLSRDKLKASYDLVSDILGAGCDIYAIIEKKLYTRADLENPMGIMGLIWRLWLAYEESLKKSDRSRQNWATKHKHGGGGGAIVTRICPGWLKVVGGDDYDKEGRLPGARFEEVPDRVAVVRKVFRWCIEGHGMQAIMKKLAAEQVRPFRSGWGQKYVWDILKDRRVLGDLPTQVYGEQKTKGEPVKGYYPAIIDQRTFDAAQDAMKSRKKRTGRRGDFVNLFTGLVKYPEHGCSMVFLSKPKKNKTGQHLYRYLASYDGWKGRKPYVAIRYDRFEDVVLGWLYDLAGDLMPTPPPVEGVEALKSRRAALARSIKDVADGLKAAGVKVAAVITTLTEMEADETKLTAEIEERQQKETRPSLDETKALLTLLKSKTGAELKELRQRVRQRLLLHIDHIKVWVREGKAWLAIKLASGVERQIWFALEGDEQGLWVGTAGSMSVPLADLDHMEAQKNEDALKRRGRLARAVVDSIDPKGKRVAYRADAGE